MIRGMLLFGLVAMAFAVAAQGAEAPKPAVEDKAADQYVPARYEQTDLGGLLGERIQTNIEDRLLRDVDEEPLLAGFRKKPGSHPWIGEHIGKFLFSASNLYAYSGNEALKEKIDRMAHELAKTQEPDGYLGTYVPEKRFQLAEGADWDVWSHKYDLLGLLTHYKRTGDAGSLAACKRVGDLLVATFGDEPESKSIISAGTHVGMAATSVLEPMVMLYRYTGDPKYLEFCKYIVRAYDEEKGPKIVKTLNETKSVRRTANAKAYEMMSNLVGLCDLYRVTGDKTYIEPALIAWEDIVKNRRYITGTTSAHEHFQDDQELPGAEKDAVGETCATVTWMQLNLQLLRLTGEVQFADELERTVYNHLLAAQNPDEGNFCYFTPLEGKKKYSGRKDINCCQSSGPRGISLIPALVWGRRGDGVVVWFYTPGKTTVQLPDGNSVELAMETDYPQSGEVVLTVNPRKAATFPIYVRQPGWCERLNVEGANVAAQQGGLVELRQEWKPGDRVKIAMDMSPRVLPGGKSYPRHVAIQRGPQVLALDAAVNPGVGDLAKVSAAATEAAQLELKPADRSALPEGWKGAAVHEIKGRVAGPDGAKEQPIRLVPFADAGQKGEEFRVWMLKPGAAASGY